MMLKRTMVVVAAFAAAIATSLTTATVASADPNIAGTFNKLTPTRLLDTRSQGGMPLKPQQTLTFNGTAGIDGTVNAVALTITAVSPTGAGWLTVYPTGGTKPLASTVNFLPGRTTPNSTIVKTGTGGSVSVFNGSTGTVDVLADLTGYWSGGTVDPTVAGSMNTLTPTRIVDTRNGAGTPLAKKSTLKVPVEGISGVPATNVSAVAVNLTVTNPTAAGWLTADAEAPPAEALTSSLNFLPKQSRAALAVVPVNPDGSISIYNGSTGTAAVIVDILGYFNDGTPSVDGAYLPSTPFRAFDTRVAGGALSALETRTFQVLPNDGVTPLIFKGLTVTVTAVTPQNPGFFTAWDGTTSLPPTSNGNFLANEDSASSMIVPVNPNDGTVSVFNGSYGNVNIIIDIDGFVLNDVTAISTPAAAKAMIAGKSHTAVLTDAVARVRAFAAKHS